MANKQQPPSSAVAGIYAGGSGAAALANVPKGPGMGSFQQRGTDHVQTLVDVLENLPAKKPSKASLRVQLCAPTLLGAKGLYDLVAAISDMVVKGASVKQVVTVALSLAFIAVAAWAWGRLTQAYEEAMAQKDPHHERLLKRARRQLVEQRRLYGELDDDDEHDGESAANSENILSPKNS